MTEQVINNAADKLRDDFEIAKIKSHTSWKALAKEFGVYPAQISRAVAGDVSPKSKVIREWLRSRLNMED